MSFSPEAPLQEKPLPLLRGDIKIYPGPNDSDGTPTYNCLDPVKGQYYKFSWLELTILEHLRPGMTLSQLTAELNQDTTLKVTAEEVQSFFEEAARSNLLAIPRTSDAVSQESKYRRVHPILWVLHHYLYIRIPILNPDAFLSRTLRYVLPFVSRPAILFYIFFTVVGVYQLIDRFAEFLTTFPYFFNLKGIIIYAIAISAVKIIHEFSHAYVAKYYRLHVPTMGIAFIVLWPVLYTDVTDGWKLNKRRERLAISFAGVAAELILAGLATFGWTISQPGLLQSIFFVVGSATWISTLAVNLNPAMRFDGYYLMCDLIGIDNLQFRAFSYTRWQLRKWFLGLNIPPPEEGLSLRNRVFMFSYSIYTWIYRLILYTVIAIFVYYEFTKALGILLFAVEIAFFILPPFVSEGRQLYRLAPLMSWNVRSIITTSVLGILLLWLILPLPHQQRFAAITVPAVDNIIYIPEEGKIKSIHFKLGDRVKRGQTLLVLYSEPLEIEINETEADIKMLSAQIHVLSLKEEDRAYIPEKTAELAEAQSRLKGLNQKRALLTVKSPFEGMIYEWDDTLLVDQHLSKNQVVAKIASLLAIQVLGFVPEHKVKYVHIDQPITFRLESNLKEYRGRVVRISPSSELYLYYPPLGSVNGGELPVNQEKDGKLALLESFFPIRVELENTQSLRFGERGHVAIRGPWHSYAADFVRYLISLYLRESGL